MIQLMAKSLSEVPEIIKPFCAESDGVVTFDESKVKTEQDVQNVKSAKDKEVADHNTTKAELAKYKVIGKKPDELQNIVDEYPTLKEGSKSNDEYLAAKRALLVAERDRDEYKTKFETAQNEVAEYKGFKVKSLRDAKWKELREKLGEKYDTDKLDTLYEDIEDKLELNEIGEIAPFKGKTALEFFENRAEKMGWQKQNTPGNSKIVPAKLPDNLKNKPELPGDEGFLDDDVARMLG